jgi:hypothetical protein
LIALLCLVWPMLPVSLDCSFLIALVFFNILKGKTKPPLEKFQILIEKNNIRNMTI